MSPWPRVCPIPSNWYLGAHGDPIAQFNRTVLYLHQNGSVTWAQTNRDGGVVAGDDEVKPEVER